MSRYESLVTQMSDGEIDLPPNKQLRADLLAVKQKLTPIGFTIYLPETADGRHADFAPSATLALSMCRYDPEGPQRKLTPQEQAIEDERELERCTVEGADVLYEEEQQEARYWRDLGIEWGRRR